ncbi:hypothetical protein [Niveispirillum fermenti]|uniref:hypothetical protein n=1 Tax=Niveispirillum fermenti TaxID=1233113 RepID=UPI003A8C2B44
MRVGWAEDRRWVALGLAFIAYGLGSAPAPPGIRLQELLVFVGIAVCAGLAVPWRFLSGLAVARGPAVLGIGSAIMVWLFWQGLVRGLWNGWGLTDMVRDIVPMMFLALPLLLAPALAHLPDRSADRLADAAAMGGVALAMRWWLDAGMALSAVGSAPLGEGRDYLLNSALIPFASVWLGLRGMDGLAMGTGWFRRVPALLALAGAACCLLAQAATLHRAGLGLSLLALLAGLALPLWRLVVRRPVWLVLGLFLLALFLLVIREPLAGVAGLLADKTQAVGLNNRADEFLAVLDQMGRSPVAFLFGDGWGALVANPAVGWWRVSYTHSAASYFLLKLGAVGLALVVIYAGLLAGLVVRSPAVPMRLLLAATPSLLLGLLLHTSFKYICFSMIISLVAGRALSGLYKRI